MLLGGATRTGWGPRLTHEGRDAGDGRSENLSRLGMEDTESKGERAGWSRLGLPSLQCSTHVLC